MDSLSKDDAIKRLLNAAEDYETRTGVYPNTAFVPGNVRRALPPYPVVVGFNIKATDKGEIHFSAPESKLKWTAQSNRG